MKAGIWMVVVLMGAMGMAGTSVAVEKKSNPAPLTPLTQEKQICDRNIVEIVGKFLKVDNFWRRDYRNNPTARYDEDANAPPDNYGNEDGVIVAEVCKVWPYKSQLTLAAFAYKPVNDDEGKRNLIVAVIDTATKRIKSSRQWDVFEDALMEINEYSLKLDTARYQIAPNVRAFGLRFGSSARGASCGEANWNDELTLYVPEERELRSVMSLYMYRQQALQGCISNQVEGAIWEDAFLTIGIEKTLTNDYFDLLIIANISGSSPRVEKQHLYYNGVSYISKSSNPWWMGW